MVDAETRTSVGGGAERRLQCPGPIGRPALRAFVCHDIKTRMTRSHRTARRFLVWARRAIWRTLAIAAASVVASSVPALAATQAPADGSKYFFDPEIAGGRVLCAIAERAQRIRPVQFCPDITSEDSGGPTFHVGTSFFDARTYLFFSEDAIPQGLRDQIEGRAPVPESAIITVEDSHTLRSFNARCPGFLTAPDFADEAFRGAAFGPHYFEIDVLDDEGDAPLLIIHANWYKGSGVLYALWTKDCRARVIARGQNLEVRRSKNNAEPPRYSLTLKLDREAAVWISGACRPGPALRPASAAYIACDGKHWLADLRAGASNIVAKFPAGTMVKGDAFPVRPPVPRYGISDRSNVSGERGICDDYLKAPGSYKRVEPDLTPSFGPHNRQFTYGAAQDYPNSYLAFAYQDLTPALWRFVQLSEFYLVESKTLPESLLSQVGHEAAKRTFVQVYDSVLLRAMNARCPWFAAIPGPIFRYPSKQDHSEQDYEDFVASRPPKLIRDAIRAFSIYDIGASGRGPRLLIEAYYDHPHAWTTGYYDVSFSDCRVRPITTATITMTFLRKGPHDFLIEPYPNAFILTRIEVNSDDAGNALPSCWATNLIDTGTDSGD